MSVWLDGMPISKGMGGLTAFVSAQPGRLRDERHMKLFKRSSDGSIEETREEKDDYPNLGALIRGSFNQDWDIIYESEDPDEIVAAVKAENTPLAIRNLIQDIELFLAKYGETSEDQNAALERVFRPEVRFYKMKGRTPREGLEKTIAILSAPSSTQS